MMGFIRRWRRELEDRLRYSGFVRGVCARVAGWRAAWLSRSGDQERARLVAALCAAARLANADAVIARLQTRILAEVDGFAGRLAADARIDWSEFVPKVDERRIKTAAILKPPVGPRERGVLFISFETQWAKLLRHVDLRDLAQRYTLVVSPSSSPHNVVNYLFAAAYPTSFFTLISNPEDMVELPRVSSKLQIVPLFASHWVNPELFAAPPPRPGRPYDLLMVASFGKVKRHHVLFKALRGMPRDTRVLLVGQDQEGRTAQTLREEARWYGVADRFELREHQPFSAVVEAFKQARASVVLSRREGSCVVVAESLFADTPVAILHGARLGSRIFVNEWTGRFVHERSLAAQLTQFVRETEKYEPRAWAVENISCYKSTALLNETLKEHALRQGQEWTQDIRPLQWCPDPALARAEDRDEMEAARWEFRERYGLELGYPPAHFEGATTPSLGRPRVQTTA